MKFLLMLLAVSTAFAQSEPVTRTKGDKDTNYKISPNIQVPNRQATKINSTTVRIETGNRNLFEDESFESGVMISSSALPTVDFARAIACRNSSDRSIITDPVAVDGTKVMSLKFGSGTGLSSRYCEIYMKIPDSMIGTNVEMSFTGGLSSKSKVCIDAYTTSGSSAGESNCKDFYGDYLAVNKSYIFSITPQAPVLRMSFTRDNEDDTSTLREAKLDTFYIGKPKSDEAIAAKFDNTTGRVRVGNATSYITAATTNPTFGTMSENDLFVTRMGDKALVEYVLTQITSGTAGSGIYRFTLPTIDGVQLKFSTASGSPIPNRNLTIKNNSTDLMAGVAQTSGTTGTIFEIFGYTYNQSTGTGTNSGSIGVGSTYMSFAQASVVFKLSFLITVPEWSSQTNAAIVACKEGPLKCYDKHIATVTGFSPYDVNQDYPWISSVTNPSTGLYEVNFTSGMYSVPPKCLLSAINTNDYKATFYQGSTASKVFVKTTGGSTVVNSTFTIECTKQGVDAKNPNETVRILENFYVDANEIVVGYDRIDNKTIYQRCHKVTSNITGTSQALVTWPSLLNPIGHPKVTSTDDWTIYHVNTPPQNFIIYYFRTTGALQYVQGTGTQYLGAGTKICMKYTR